MRLSPDFSEVSFNLSFFLTTPARKPRTECFCQSVAFMIAAMVVPLDWRSILRTASCLEGAPVGLATACLRATSMHAALGLVTEDLAPDCSATRFADFD